MPRD
ncbi:hypothetical protein PENDEC_c051G03009 [Penicillium decumbens]|jgi:hypothetical protein